MKEVRGENKKFLESNENENTTYENFGIQLKDGNL
jgi:hypothetical protein